MSVLRATRQEVALNAICPYFTMFPLDFPLSILRTRAEPGCWVLDPFCGRGTTLYAARLCRVPAAGIDSNPVATAITQAKLVDVRPAAIVAELEAILARAPSPLSVPQGAFWALAFHHEVLEDLCRVREELLRDCSTPERQALRGILLGALHGPRPKGRPSYLSNQSPRTYAPKPAYAVRYWRRHGLSPTRVDIADVVSVRAHRYYANVPPEVATIVIEGDSRDATNFAALARRGVRPRWIITSPPYYGLKTYRPDQWLRLWFLGGADTPDYSAAGQISHASPRAFIEDLRSVWQHVADISRPDAQLIVRFGRINDRRVDPLSVLQESLEHSGWQITSIESAGTAATGKRQARHFTVTGDAIEEHDVWAARRD